ILRSIPASVPWLPRRLRDDFSSWTAGGAPVEHEPIGDMIEAGMATYRLKLPIPALIEPAGITALRMPTLVILAERSPMHDAAAASAQLRWGRPTVPRDGACFYRDAGFRGDYFCVRAGEDLPYIPGGLNDEISSIRTFGRAVVTVYRDKRFSGRAERFGEDVW